MMGKDGSFVRWTPHPRTERMYDLDKVEFRDDGLVFTMLQDDDWRHDHRLRLTWIWGTVVSYQVSEETYREDCWLPPGEEPWCFFVSDASPWLEEYWANSGFLPEDTRHYLLVGTNLIADVLASEPPRVERLEGGLPTVDWPIPAGVRQCLETLDRERYYAYPVGGCVRDLLLGRTPGDWDVCTDARPERVMELFPRTVPTGLKHGTVTVLTEDGPVEVTTFRREGGYADGRHPDAVDFDATLAEDLARRDFTVNAMALDERGMVIDLYGGQMDLFRRLIRCVGDPDTRFAEDALRMLRAVRFAAQLGFSIEEGTLAAIRRNANRAAHLSGERIKAELEKILLSPRPEKAGDALRLGLLAHLGAGVLPPHRLPHHLPAGGALPPPGGAPPGGGGGAGAGDLRRGAGRPGAGGGDHRRHAAPPGGPHPGPPGGQHPGKAAGPCERGAEHGNPVGAAGASPRPTERHTVPTERTRDARRQAQRQFAGPCRDDLWSPAGGRTPPLQKCSGFAFIFPGTGKIVPPLS